MFCHLVNEKGMSINATDEVICFEASLFLYVEM